jgi:hypothetical protein
VIGYLGFSRRGVFIGEGAASDQGALTIGGRGQAQAKGRHLTRGPSP